MVIILVISWTGKYGSFRKIWFGKNTMYKKPGALTHSTALQQADTKVKNIYEHYYSRDAKTFLGILEIIYEKGIDAVDDALRELERISPLEMSVDKVRMVCDHAAERKQSISHKYEDTISQKTRSTLINYNALAEMQRANRMVV